ncbi:zinc/cadmium/mercury/lead-transporting ATPase [Moritella viscosa]|uniref:zinc/cadmium/mercury/lead-transporting ATPase n=1 Tax=Moritella viscosa TaxID=80854 RepID=UPI00090EC6D5|nr:zinc/cadmium/mercury/lead-transporting ATPase [Moritella viscosa]SHN96763.1 Cation transport ATPase, E1-E2 family [Moritella viscosa]SHN96765.1 Cation transport ATPase, E1-E2 family [Moritella viscosa]SHN97069.1 Cation transport ATPase, E1-E2 family [Moritella viscosa]SHN97445.1 Cation transport ATPase, E1-E2 family [Moritella viscosa]
MSCKGSAATAPKSNQGCCANDHSKTHVHEHQHSDEHKTSSNDTCCAHSESNEISPDDEEPESSSLTTRLSWLVTGMDCPSCAGKVEKAVQALPQVTQCRVAFSTEKLLVDIEEDINSSTTESIKQQINDAVVNAGFKLQQVGKKTADREEITSLAQSFREHWHAITLVSAIVIAALLTQVNSNASQWVFTFASVFGVIPVINRSIKLALSGTPFAIETLMSVATVGALILGETAESAMVLVLFMIGEKLESFAAGKARKGVKSLMSLVPEEATKIVGHDRVLVAASDLQPGDIIEIKPGDRLPADGALLASGISFDESALTGESVPVEHQADDIVMAGSLAVNRVAQLRVVSEPGNNAIDRILHLIEEAEENKAPIERFLDRFSRWYTPAMMLLALVVVIVPPLLFGSDWTEWVYKGLTLLLIACPCALVISTPAAVTSALSAASKRGVLVKGGAALEQIGRIQQIAFDKTGTLTQGVPEVTSIVSFIDDENKVLQLAASIEQTSNHPLAKAILMHAELKSVALLAVSHDQTLAGLGVQGEVQLGESAQLIKLLAPHHMTAQLAQLPEVCSAIVNLENGGNTTVVVLQNEIVIGLVALADRIREDAREAVEKLQKLGINTVMLTGDNRRTAKVIADSLGMEYRAELLPEDKSRIVGEINQAKDTAMVGDGINDAPAMKRAKLGIAMGGGTDVALEAADVALMHNRLVELPHMVELGQATLANIKQNITLAVGLKAVFLVTTLLGFTGLWVAILADSGATALVTANALRLLRFNGKK